MAIDHDELHFPGVLFLYITRWLRGSRSLELLGEIRRNPFVPRKELLDRQFSKLSALLEIAEMHVPYYREMFHSLGIRSRDIRSLTDFARLPILTKDIIRERQRDLVRDNVDFKTLAVKYTGGSTGVPLKFYCDNRTLDASDAAWYRNLMQCGWRCGELVASIWGGDARLYAMSKLEFELRMHLRRRYQFDPFKSGSDDMDHWLVTWRRIKPRAVFGYASSIARFAAHIEGRNQTVPPVRGVFTTAEKLYPHQRELISRVFSAKVYDCYGSSEVRNIATECPQGHMHVNADFVVLERDDSGIPPNIPAPFIVTSLWNSAMPFIRYRNEDCGCLLPGECDCGNHFPLMELNVARISDNFVLPNGRVLHGEYFTHLMYGSSGIAMFQFHQTSPNTIVLWVVPNAGAANERTGFVRNVVEQISKLDPAVAVDVRETDAIPLSSTGKHRFTRSDVRSESIRVMSELEKTSA